MHNSESASDVGSNYFITTEITPPNITTEFLHTHIKYGKRVVGYPQGDHIYCHRPLTIDHGLTQPVAYAGFFQGGGGSLTFGNWAKNFATTHFFNTQKGGGGVPKNIHIRKTQVGV